MGDFLLYNVKWIVMEKRCTMKKYKWLLFDADNTLLDFTRAERAGITDTLIGMGLPATDEVVTTYSKINDGLWKDLERGLVTKERLKVVRFERLCQHYSLDGDPVAIAAEYVKNLSKYGFLCDGALELCRALYGKYDMYIITNGIKVIQDSRFAKSGIKDYFTRAFISDEIGCEKPGRAFFDYVASSIDGFDPAYALVIGDSLTSDILGGVNYGIDTCWVNPKGHEKPADLPITYTVTTLSEVASLLGEE
jgi:2-haloacid dehalogenase